LRQGQRHKFQDLLLPEQTYGSAGEDQLDHQSTIQDQLFATEEKRKMSIADISVKIVNLVNILSLPIASLHIQEMKISQGILLASFE
jgi:hypothetical protein